VNTAPPAGADDGVCEGVGGSAAGADCAGAVGVGDAVGVGGAADCVAVGSVVGDSVIDAIGLTFGDLHAVGLAFGDLHAVRLVLGVFDAVGAGLSDAEAADAGTAAIVTAAGGELAPVDVTLQPATTPTMREAPTIMRVALRQPPSDRSPDTICHVPLRSSRREATEPSGGWLAILICYVKLTDLLGIFGFRHGARLPVPRGPGLPPKTA
jgi:hypothetical protein